MSYVKGSQLPSTSTVADTDTLIVTQEGDSKATKKVAKKDLLKEDRTRLTDLETDNTTNKNNITNLQQENQTLKNNVKALEYVINNSNRLNYTGEIITNSNSAVGDIRNIIVNGNTHYKKSDGTYTDTWESGVALESMGEKEKNSNGKYPIIIKSSNDTKEDKRTVLLDSPLRKVGAIADVLDLEKMKVTRNCKTAIFDGSSDENWTYAGNNIFAIPFIGYKKVDLTTNSLLNCDKFAVTSHNVLNNMSGSYIAFESSYTSDNYLKIRKPDATDLATFKTWLQSNPVTIVYALATPTTEDIEVSPTDNPLTSYTPSTTLTTNNTIKGNISADMPTNLSGVITQQASLIAQLEDNLLQTQALLIDNVIDNA